MVLPLMFTILALNGLATGLLGINLNPGRPGPGLTLLKHPLTAVTTILGLKLLSK